MSELVKTQERKTHLYALDYIRAISALLIVVYHYTTQYQTLIGHVGHWPVSVPFGSWAVNTFFLLTGFLTVRNYNVGGIRFLFKRFARLWPAFAVSVVLTSVCMAVLMPENLLPLKDILLNFTMFPIQLGVKAVDGVYWTLAVEIIFYFWIMLLMTGNNQKRLTLGLYAWTLTAIGLNLCNRAGINVLPVKLLNVLLIPERVACFILGAVICLRGGGTCTHTRAYWLLAGLCAVSLFLWQGPWICLWTFGWGAVIWAVASGKLSLALKKESILHKALVFLAGISYPVYLLHQFIGFAIIRSIEALGGYSQLWMLVPIAVSLLLATAVHYWVELPAGNWLVKKEASVYRAYCEKRSKDE